MSIKHLPGTGPSPGSGRAPEPAVGARLSPAIVSPAPEHGGGSGGGAARPRGCGRRAAATGRWRSGSGRSGCGRRRRSATRRRCGGSWSWGSASTPRMKSTDVEDELPDLKQDSNLPIIPNYLANPPFPYVYNTLSTSIPDPTLNGNLSHLEPQDTNSPSIPDLDTCGQARAPLQPGNAAPEAPSNRDIPPLSRGSAGPSHPSPVLQRAPVYQGSVSWGRSPSSSAGSNQSPPQQGNSSCTGPVPAFQPIFFTGAFPLNMQELVLKVRIQTPHLRENDFIEIELDRQELTYKELLRVSCHELGVNPEHVQKIRKLPNTILRKDKDVARLQDFQELELVLTSSEPEQCPCSCWGSPGLSPCAWNWGPSTASTCPGGCGR
ncbi:ankyrin repeat domain-containing protein 40 isoform X1 [Vidua chalybeata]|uniref:ankyrin repeat domain-containing protein 40 isoform X1 n=1 Tax=Vidua chalybeata TaxID=81927 RepID=UPI0023A8397D|nr:ankyrin repeat domain-containing protein 40 isoform X1 [Vidua chalybeata]